MVYRNGKPIAVVITSGASPEEVEEAIKKTINTAIKGEY